MRILRLIYGVTRRDRIRNDSIRAALKVTSILSIIEKSQLRWFGHVIRMFDWKLEAKRPLGRPRKRWNDQIKEITSKEIDDFDTVETTAKDRKAWRSFTKRLIPDGP